MLSGFVKCPSSKFTMCTVMLKSVFALIVAMFFGFWNLAEGILLCAAIAPIGVWLHEPSTICCPFVFALPGTVRQKLMKLFCDVIDASWPAVGVSWPVSEKLKMLLGSIVSDVCASPPAAAELAAGGAAAALVAAAAVDAGGAAADEAALPLAALLPPLFAPWPALPPLKGKARAS